MQSSKSDSSGGQMKQKSLMGWFSKAQTGAQPSSTSKAQPSKSVSKGGTSDNVATSLNDKKTSKQRLATSSSMASLKSSSGASNLRSHDTPPTSDAIDVDMHSDEDEGAGASISVRLQQLKLCLSHLVRIESRKAKNGDGRFGKRSQAEKATYASIIRCG